MLSAADWHRMGFWADSLRARTLHPYLIYNTVQYYNICLSTNDSLAVQLPNSEGTKSRDHRRTHPTAHLLTMSRPTAGPSRPLGTNAPKSNQPAQTSGGGPRRSAGAVPGELPVLYAVAILSRIHTNAVA